MRRFLSHILIVLILTCISNLCLAQKAELTGGVSGNIFNYGGTAAVTDGYYSNAMVLSKKLTAGYGGNIQIKLVAEDGFIIGMQSGYDLLRSTADIKSMVVYDGCVNCLLAPTPSPTGSIYGYATNATKFVNLNPFLGYRVKKSKLAIDFTLGADFAFVTEDKNHTVYTSNYSSDQTTYFDRSKLYYVNYSKTDVRIKTGVGLWYNRFGLDLSYEHGLNNLIEPQNGDPYYYNPGSAFSQVLKVGINFRIL